MDNAPITLILSPRDLQWLIVSLNTAAMTLDPNTNINDLLDGLDTLKAVFEHDYSPDEGDAFMERAMALLPLGSNLRDVDDAFAPRTPDLCS